MKKQVFRWKHGVRRRQFAQSMMDDDRRNRLQMSVLSALIGVVSAAVCVWNAMQGETISLAFTLVMAILSFVTVTIVSYNTRTLTAGYWLFAVNLVLLSIYLLLFDGTSFGVLWLCAISSFSPMLLGRLRGHLLNVLIFLILVFVLWTPWGASLVKTPYEFSFAVRFSLLYVLCFLLSHWFESVRATTSAQLQQMQKQLRDMSVRDTLTGIYNRHFVSREMPNIMKNCAGKTRLAVMIIDIDYFKKLNDTHGHLFGDAVLKQVADLLLSVVEPVGYLCRWGGEEFAVLAEGLDEEETMQLAEELRDAVEHMNVADENGERQLVTISIGAVSMMPTEDMRPDFLINCADNALYAGKNAGRNSVRYYAGDWYYRDIEEDDLMGI